MKRTKKTVPIVVKEDDLEDFDAWWSRKTGTKIDGKAYSSFWTSKIDNWNEFSYSKGSSINYDAILESVSRSANITTNAASGKEEKKLDVQWVSGENDRNSSDKSEIFLSTYVVDPSRTEKPSWTDDERIDVLIGEALCQSMLKSTINGDVEKKITAGQRTNRGMLTAELWTAAEHLYAESKVLDVYPGFNGYFAARRDYYTSDHAKRNLELEISDAKKDNQMRPELAVAGLMWDVMHPDKPLDTSPDVREFIDSAMTTFRSPTDCEGRAKASKKIVDNAYKLFQLGEDDGKKRRRAGAGPIVEGLEIGIGMSEAVRGATIASGRARRPSWDAAGDYTVPKHIEGADYAGGIIDYKVEPNGFESDYDSLRKELTPYVRDLKTRLKLRHEEHRMIEHGLKRGRLDEGSIYKLEFEKYDYHDEKIFEDEEIISLPNVGIGLLVDESGSMGGGTGDYSSSHTKISMAKRVAIIIAEALYDIPGVQFGVWGHTGEGRFHGGHTRKMVIHQYYTPENPRIASLARLYAFEQNLDGYAIGYVAKEIKRQFVGCKKNILIHISDGEPAAAEYGGKTAMQHVGKMCTVARRDGVDVIAIGVTGAFTTGDGNIMYGPGNYVVLKGMAGIIPIISNIITRVSNSR